MTVALACAALAGWLALNHPLSPTVAVAAVGLLAGLSALQPARWPLLVLPLLPVIGLMPWTGWLVVEELDLVVLAVAAGAYLGLALRTAVASARARRGATLPAWLLLGLVAACTTYSAALGVSDAGGWRWGWWHGYREPLNAVRLAKPVFAVLLLLPLWSYAQRLDSNRAHGDLRIGLTACLLMTALAVVWERAAFTGLLNFSSDYRAVGLFWEMHVGGAALDAVLAMTLPVAMASLASERRVLPWLALAGTVTLGLYASIATFSRIVFLAVPVALALGWLLDRIRSPGALRVADLAAASGVLVAGWAAGAVIFGASGYRGLLALTGALTLVLLLPALARTLAPLQRAVGLLAGLSMAALVGVTAAGVPKGAYAAVGLTWLVAAGAVLAGRRANGPVPAMVFLGTVVSAWAGVLAVTWAWAGGIATERAAMVVLPALVGVMVLSMAPRGVWPDDLRWQGQLALTLVGGMAVIAVFGGGAYMADRLQGASQDSQGRLSHWRQSLGLLRTEAQSTWGLGLGRYLAQQAVSGVPEFQTGDYRLVDEGQGRWLLLTSGSHVQGWGEIFRVSQRIEVPPPGPLRVRLRARADAPLTLHVEVCEKHLLYSEICKVANQTVATGPQGWQQLDLELKGVPITGGPWYAPRFVAFSVGIASVAGRVDLDDIALSTFDGRDLLRNGNFDLGMSRWFFSSDRHHMPWHAKNLAVHLWVEQGLVGLAAFGLAVAGALGRCLFGASGRHPSAPVLAAALVGVLIVGMVDSVLDMPRVAFVVLLLTAVALSLPSRGPAGRQGSTL